MEKKLPVIAVFDIGKTNKKLLVFNEGYEVVAEESTSFPELTDEDGFACEDIDRLSTWISNHVEQLKQSDRFDLKAINFSTYGASVVYVDEAGERIAPLYNYLKPYPDQLIEKFSTAVGGSTQVSLETSSPIMGHLNAGLQVYWLKEERPALFAKLHRVLHFPQFLSSRLTGSFYAEMTNLGCHSAMWDFRESRYHPWLAQQGIRGKLADVIRGNTAMEIKNGPGTIRVGVGLHDSSAAVIPYLAAFNEPFVIVSTGTWTVSLNPFNNEMPTSNELASGCLSYLTYEGSPVKASMIFAGHDHDQQVKRLAAHYQLDPAWFRNVAYNPEWINLPEIDGRPAFGKSQPLVGAGNTAIDAGNTETAAGKTSITARNTETAGGNNQTTAAAADSPTAPCVFHTRNLDSFDFPEHAYHQLIADIIDRQAIATGMVLVNSGVKKMFVDGGFCQNGIYMQLLADAFPAMDVCSTSMVQGTALGAALAIHEQWNTQPLPDTLIRLKHWPASTRNQPVG
ncbi:MAG: carbohydrate kinase [Chitinophagaceae bacterium]|nr:MAG: carbohydrate kinase [Chitinophagaceae bacterium]